MSKQEELHALKAETLSNKPIEIDAYEMAQNLAKQSQEELALKWFSMVTESHPQYLNALREKIFILLIMKRWSEASLACDILLKKSPEDAEAYLCMGVIYSNLGNTEQTLIHFDKTIELDKDGHHAAEALCRKGRVLEEKSRFDEALKCYQDALAIKKTDERISSSIKKLQKTQYHLNTLLGTAADKGDIKEIKNLMAQGAKPDDSILEILKRMLKPLNYYNAGYSHYDSAPGYYQDPQEDCYIPFPLKEPNYDTGTIENILKALNLSDKYRISHKMIKSKKGGFSDGYFEYELQRINLTKVDSIGTLLSHLSLIPSKKEYKETQIDQAYKILRQKLKDTAALEKLNFKFVGKDLLSLEFPKDSKLTPEEIYEIAVVLNKIGLTFAEPGDRTNAIECLRTNAGKSYIAYDERPAEPLKFPLSVTRSLLLEKLGIAEKNEENLFSFT